MKCLETEQSRNSVAHYSPGVIDRGTLYISGQLPRNEKGELPDGGLREQTRAALDNVEKVLHLGGCRKEDVVKCTIYTTSGAFWGDINDEYARFFGTHRPARVLIPIGDFGNGCLVEIEAIAQKMDLKGGKNEE